MAEQFETDGPEQLRPHGQAPAEHDIRHALRGKRPQRGQIGMHRPWHRLLGQYDLTRADAVDQQAQQQQAHPSGGGDIVNPLPFDGAEYLVAPRGTTQWVRNLRVAGGGELRVGRRVDAFTFVEVPDTDKVPVLRAYLTLWKFEVGRFFDGVGPDATDSEISAIAVGYPVFRVIRAAS